MFACVLGVLDLRCCLRVFSSWGEQGLFSRSVQASPWGGLSFGEHRLWGTRASLPQGMWDLPGPGTKPTPLALAGRFLTTGRPEKSQIAYLFH